MASDASQGSPLGDALDVDVTTTPPGQYYLNQKSATPHLMYILVLLRLIYDTSSYYFGTGCSKKF